MAYLRYTLSVLWPTIFIAAERGTPARSRFLMAVRRKSCGMRWLHLAKRLNYLGRELMPPFVVDSAGSRLESEVLIPAADKGEESKNHKASGSSYRGDECVEVRFCLLGT
jgi:hypothetical protein